jgi:hypothetical protein
MFFLILKKYSNLVLLCLDKFGTIFPQMSKFRVTLKYAFQIVHVENQTPFECGICQYQVHQSWKE